MKTVDATTTLKNAEIEQPKMIIFIYAHLFILSCFTSINMHRTNMLFVS